MDKPKLIFKTERDLFGVEFLQFNIELPYEYLEKSLEERKGIKLVIPIMIPKKDVYGKI